jgi:hypothetical protein
LNFTSSGYKQRIKNTIVVEPPLCHTEWILFTEKHLFSNMLKFEGVQKSCKVEAEKPKAESCIQEQEVHSPLALSLRLWT